MGRSLTGPGNIAKLGDTMLGPFNEAKAPDLPSSPSLNLITTKGNLVDITGTTTILSMNLASGAERTLRFTGSLRLTNGPSLVLPGGEDIITMPNDMAIVRGYPNGVVRFVSYSRAAGYVQRGGDKLSGTLTFAPGNATSPPVKYQMGSLTTIPVANSFEWDGGKAYFTTAGGFRKEVLYKDGNGSSLTDFTSKQITDALGYVPFDPTSTPNRISPNGGTLELGRYLNLHYATGDNEYDARIEVTAPTGAKGTSKLLFTASEVQVGGSKVWTAGNLTKVSQLLNDSGYLTSAPGGASTPFTGYYGYQALDSGVILQWGKKYGGGGSGMVWVSFPITFPNTIFTAQICYEVGLGVTPSNGLAVANASTSGMFVTTESSDVWWFAIGF